MSNVMNDILSRYLEEIELLKGKLSVRERDLTKTKIELKAANKHLTEIIDYTKFYICPTCTNCCSNCPVWDFAEVECSVCGNHVYRKDLAGSNFEGDYICKRCEREGSE